MSGIYAGDGDKLSLQATFPYLRDLEVKHGGLVKGALAVRTRADGGIREFQRNDYSTRELAYTVRQLSGFFKILMAVTLAAATEMNKLFDFRGFSVQYPYATALLIAFPRNSKKRARNSSVT